LKSTVRLAVGQAAVVEHLQSTLNTSWWAFSISSSGITMRLAAPASVRWPPSS
jgi:hypothetical protein